MIDLTTEEQLVMEAINDVMKRMKILFDDDYPYNWTNEGIPAIHVLQHFVMQHYAHRCNPTHWGSWTIE